MMANKSSTKLLPRVTHGFDSANSPRDSEIINKLLSIGQPKQHLGTQKSSTKVIPWLRHGINNANSP
jgi:hypothetical protein